MQQLAVITAAHGALDAPAAPPPTQGTASVFGWLDDWAPEASGIFRILRRAPSAPEIAHDASRPLPAHEVPLPHSRPPAPVETSGAALAALRTSADSSPAGPIER
jgi:hypothetical protein